jgi:glutamyl-tRNA reductase
MVVGLNHRTAPLAMRERFWIAENRRYDALRQLKKAEGIEEAIILVTAWRTEFLLWASEPTLAANSLLQFLTATHGLKLSEWEHFYRLLDDSALAHIFRVTSGTDSALFGGLDIARQLKLAWEQAHTIGAAGSFLSAAVESALRVSEQIRHGSAPEQDAVSIPSAALIVARQIFGSVEGRNILLLGTDEITESSGRQLIANGAASLVVIDQSLPRAQELALALGGTAAEMAERWKQLMRADIVITSSGCPHVILTREEAEHIAAERNRVALLILDLGMPRDVDPEVRRVDGILLHDLESLELVFECNHERRNSGTCEAEKIITAEVLAFRTRPHTDSGMPNAVNLRRRLDELCRQELDAFIEERGPFSREQDRYLHVITGQLMQTIASFLARELKEVPEKAEQERMATAISRLFHLDSPQQAIAGTISEKQHQPDKQNVVAINY